MKSIRFDTRQVRATLDGLMTETRRPIKPQPILKDGFWRFKGAGWSDNINVIYPFPCHSMYNAMPYQPGDILYVRETWCREWKDPDGWTDNFLYKADGIEVAHVDYGLTRSPWKPSIHMPREAARIFLRVTDVRAERLQDITEEGAMSEGVDWLDDACYANNRWTPTYHDPDSGGSPVFRDEFANLWDSVYKSRGHGWDTNPWVWKISFERIDRSEVPE